jgi:hypothetical protein
MLLAPVGIYIAKAIFQVHYVDGETGEIVNKPTNGQSSLSIPRTVPPA